MKVFLFLAVLQLIDAASIRGPTNADENLQALEDQLLETGHEAGAHHSHADHHRDEQHASPEAQTREFTEPIYNRTADGTGKPVSDPPRGLSVGRRPTKPYDAIINRERRSPKPMLPPEQVSLNCREVVAVGVKDPYTCAKLGQGKLPGDPATYGVSPNAAGDVIGPDGNVIFADPMGAFSTGSNLDLAKAPGRCRFDPYKASVDPNTACLCVATAATCTDHRDGCYWFEDKKTGNKECISNAERFYDHLYMLLHKRGKKDFAINIRYGGTPARGSLPMGPLGPQIIGQGNPNALNPDGTASPVPSDPFAFGQPMGGLPFNPMMSQAGFPPMPADSFGGLPTIGGAVPGFGMMPGGAPAYGVPSYGMPSTPGYGMPTYGAPSTPGYGMPPFTGAPSTPGYGMPNYGAPSMYNYGMPQLAS